MRYRHRSSIFAAVAVSALLIGGLIIRAGTQNPSDPSPLASTDAPVGDRSTSPPTTREVDLHIDEAVTPATPPSSGAPDASNADTSETEPPTPLPEDPDPVDPGPLPLPPEPDPLGFVDPSAVPPDWAAAGDFAAEMPPDYEPTHDGPNQFSPGPGCAYQCIASGVAHPRGFGAVLDVETKVPADLWMSVIADTTGDGDYDFSAYETSPSKATSFSWPLDHLEPDTTYYVVLVATDEHDASSHAFGEFTTLSTRNLMYVVTDYDIHGGPTNITGRAEYLWKDDADPEPYDIGMWREAPDVARHIELALHVTQGWSVSKRTLCEGWAPQSDATYFSSDGICGTTNTARATVDLDWIPNESEPYAGFTFEAELSTPTGDGALPPGYGDPRYFGITADVLLLVTYE